MSPRAWSPARKISIGWPARRLPISPRSTAGDARCSGRTRWRSSKGESHSAWLASGSGSSLLREDHVRQMALLHFAPQVPVTGAACAKPISLQAECAASVPAARGRQGDMSRRSPSTSARCDTTPVRLPARPQRANHVAAAQAVARRTLDKLLHHRPAITISASYGSPGAPAYQHLRLSSGWTRASAAPAPISPAHETLVTGACTTLATGSRQHWQGLWNCTTTQVPGAQHSP